MEPRNKAPQTSSFNHQHEGNPCYIHYYISRAWIIMQHNQNNSNTNNENMNNNKPKHA